MGELREPPTKQRDKTENAQSNHRPSAVSLVILVGSHDRSKGPVQAMDRELVSFPFQNSERTGFVGGDQTPNVVRGKLLYGFVYRRRIFDGEINLLISTEFQRVVGGRRILDGRHGTARSHRRGGRGQGKAARQSRNGYSAQHDGAAAMQVFLESMGSREGLSTVWRGMVPTTIDSALFTFLAQRQQTLLWYFSSCSGWVLFVMFTRHRNCHFLPTRSTWNGAETYLSKDLSLTSAGILPIA